jgi:hypothetical protein
MRDLSPPSLKSFRHVWLDHTIGSFSEVGGRLRMSCLRLKAEVENTSEAEKTISVAAKERGADNKGRSQIISIAPTKRGQRALLDTELHHWTIRTERSDAWREL